MLCRFSCRILSKPQMGLYYEKETETDLHNLVLVHMHHAGIGKRNKFVTGDDDMVLQMYSDHVKRTVNAAGEIIVLSGREGNSVGVIVRDYN